MVNAHYDTDDRVDYPYPFNSVSALQAETCKETARRPEKRRRHKPNIHYANQRRDFVFFPDLHILDRILGTHTQRNKCLDVNKSMVFNFQGHI